MKVVALSFLVGATVVFLLCSWAQADGAAPWVGYVRAAAEAGMVGALADWFAVTALFKHPLRIPIPHTAIIKRKKDQLGEGLGAFVRENFMSPEVVETKLRDAQVAGRLGKWLSEPSHAAAGGRRSLQRAAGAGGDAARRGRPARAGPDDRQAHRRAAVGSADRPGACPRCWPSTVRKRCSSCSPIGRSSGRSTPARSSSGWSSVTRRPGRRAGSTISSATGSTGS